MTDPGVGPLFDEVIHAPNRLHICALLAPVDALAFSTVRDELGVSDPVLSKHVKVLQASGYVTLTKTTSSRRLRTWLTLTPKGRRALEGHLAELRRIAALAGSIT